MLRLVTAAVTIPIECRFDQPDPVYPQGRRQEQRLRRQGVPKRQRPLSPARDPRYPRKLELALVLLAAFRQEHPHGRIHA